MKFSLNCLLLGEASDQSIPVIIGDQIIVNNNKIKYDQITVSNVKSLILSERKIDCSLNNLKLWKVDRVSVDKNDEMLGTFSTEDDIKEKLGGKFMNPRYPLSDYFDENSFEDNKNKYAIHIIVQLLTTTLNVAVSLFKDSCSTLEWVEKYTPSAGTKLVSLVDTFGAQFTLCGRDGTIETLWNGSRGSNGILGRLKYFLLVNPHSTSEDRNYHPLPFLACGPGTGKSRFLQELVSIIRNKVSESQDRDVISILGNAVFLNITYGNGTEASDFDMDIRAEASVALRILYNYFVNGNENQSFIKFRDETVGKNNARELTLGLVLRTIYESKRKKDINIKKFAIVVGIDEINKVYEKDQGLFRNLISAIGSMSCSREMFFVPVLAGTVEGPLQEIITKSMHPPLQLPLHLLDMNDMLQIASDLGFDKSFIDLNKLFRRMISDIGGHVRALELFYKYISDESRTHGWNDINLLDIMISLEDNLNSRYPFEDYADMITPVLANAILEIPVRGNETPVKDKSKPSITYKSLKSSGILTLEPTKNGFYVRLPYLWMRLLLKNAVKQSINQFWHVMIDPNESFYWQDWEIFNIKFLALRYCLFSALGYKRIKLEVLLKGAYYSKSLDVDAIVDIPDPESVMTHSLLHRFPPSNASNGNLSLQQQQKSNYDMLNNEGKTCSISLKDNSKIYKNGGGAEGDGFCFLIADGKPMFLSLQMKWRERDSVNPSKIDDYLIEAEYKKSKKVAEKIGLNNDWILLILSNRESIYTKDKVPSNCAIVDKDNFNDFYGKIYSSRAQFFAAHDKIHINTATFCELQVIYGVGEKIAEAIVEDRDNSKRKYTDDDDLCKRITKFPKVSLGCISY